MRYCHNCGRVTTGEPLFCQFCGRTYNVKLCPRHHPNPRSAQVCSQCGSNELTIPAPRTPFWLKPVFFLLSFVPGIGLLLLSVLFVLVFIRQLITDPNMLFGLMVVGLILGLLWFVYMQLPGFLRKIIHKGISKGGKHDKGKH